MPPKNNLVIVESGAKARTIEKYLTDLKNHGRFRVVASLGHVVDLPPKEMGIDFDTWSMKYVPIAEKRSVLQKIQKMVQESDMVYLAADPDREGEAIAKNLYDVLGLTPERTRRAVFHEITPQAITQAILNPRDIDMALVDAQETRRILDRMVGYKLSPLLWRRFSGYNLSAGRVQTAALRMVVERAKEVDDFRPEPIWEIHGTFHVPSPIETTLEGGPMHDRKQVEALMKELARNGGTAAWTASFKTRRVKKSPSPPFTTTCLQQEAHSRYGFGAKTTMQLAQALYEGGHITYMRTDSTSLSKTAKDAVHGVLKERFGEEMVHDRDYKTRVANAQEAHECIRPTNPAVMADMLGEDVGHDHKRLYDLVWRRTIASQMPPAIYMELSTSVVADMPALNGKAFVGTTRVLVEKGYLEVWSPNMETGEMAEREDEVPAQAVGFRAPGDATRPPPLFQEPMLVKALEKAGIGRPSTYASTMDKLLSKRYIARGTAPLVSCNVQNYEALMDIRKVATDTGTITMGGGDANRFIPTPTGKDIVQYLTETVPDAVDIGFTASMEAKLDSISNREMEKNSILDEFWGGFEKVVDQARQQVKQQPRAPTSKKQPKTIGEDVQVLTTRYGPALFVPSQKRYIDLQSFLDWRGKTAEDVDGKDARFLLSLPLHIGTMEVMIGRYGLYVKEDGKNHNIHRDLWDDLYEGTVEEERLRAGITAGQGKMPYRKKGAGGRPSAQR